MTSSDHCILFLLDQMIGMEFSMWHGAPTAEEFLIGLNIRLVKEYSKVLDA